MKEYLFMAWAALGLTSWLDTPTLVTLYFMVGGTFIGYELNNCIHDYREGLPSSHNTKRR